MASIGCRTEYQAYWPQAQGAPSTAFAVAVAAAAMPDCAAVAESQQGPVADPEGEPDQAGRPEPHSGALPGTLLGEPSGKSPEKPLGAPAGALGSLVR